MGIVSVTAGFGASSRLAWSKVRYFNVSSAGEVCDGHLALTEPKPSPPAAI